jgi:hypothetical protein
MVSGWHRLSSGTAVGPALDVGNLCLVCAIQSDLPGCILKQKRRFCIPGLLFSPLLKLSQLPNHKIRQSMKTQPVRALPSSFLERTIMSPVLMDFTIALGFTGFAAFMLPLAYAYFERVPANKDISIQLSLVAFAITVVLAFAFLYFVTAAFSAETLQFTILIAALGPIAMIVLITAIWKISVSFLIREEPKQAQMTNGSNGHLTA